MQSGGGDGDRDLSPSNFFPHYSYPGEHTAAEMYRKQEFYRYRLEKREALPTVKGHYMNHQLIAAQQLSAESPLDGLLMVAAMGTGKGCAATAILESAKASGKYEGGVVITQSKELEANFIMDLVNSCTAKGKYLPWNWDSIPEKRRLGAMRNMLAPWYKFMDVGVVRGYMERSPRNFLNSLRGHIVIIDEAHNLKPVAKKRDGKKDTATAALMATERRLKQERYDTFHAFLHGLVRCKKVLMTGTPMRNSYAEIADLLNLILPASEQLPTGEAFQKKFGALEPGSESTKLLLSRMAGRVSFLNAATLDMGELFMQRRYPGSNVSCRSLAAGPGFPLYEDLASDIQAEVVAAIGLQTTGMGFEASSKARQYESMVFPDGSYGIEGEKRYIVTSAMGKIATFGIDPMRAKSEEEKEKLMRFGPDAVNKSSAATKRGLETYSVTRPMMSFLKRRGGGTILDNIGRLSCKYESILREILDRPYEKVFVFSEILNGGGLNALSALMRVLGFSRYSSGALPATKRRRFLLLTGRSGSGFRNLVDVFNDPRNVRGDYIQVILGSKVVSEGFTFRDVMQMHNTGAFWNYAPVDQASKRILRHTSHDQLVRWYAAQTQLTVPENVRVFLHAMVAPNDMRSRDCALYARSYEKDIKIKAVERLMKRAAVDCLLFYERNRSSDRDEDGSRACQYQECCYTCAGPVSEPVDIPVEERDTSTFMKYYSGDSEKAIAAAVGDMAAAGGLYSLSNEQFYAEVQSRLRGRPQAERVFVDRLSFLATVSDMASRNDPLETPYGARCYLRYKPDVWYLSLSGHATTPSVDEWYTEHPMFVETQSPERAMFYTLLGKTSDFIRKLRVLARASEREDGVRDIWVMGPMLISTLRPAVQEVLLECRGAREEIFKEFIEEYYAPRVHNVRGLGEVSVFMSYNSAPEEESMDRVLVPGADVWRVCTPAESALTRKHVTEYRRARNAALTQSPYGFFGVYVNADSSIKFVDVDAYLVVRRTLLDGGAIDLRRVPTGVVCGTGKYPVEKIVGYILGLGISHVEGLRDIAGKTRAEIAKDVEAERSVLSRHLAGLGDDGVRILGSWSYVKDNMSGKMCAAILERLSREGLVLRVIEDPDIKKELLF